MGFAQGSSAPWQSRARSVFKDFLRPCPLLSYCNNRALKRRKKIKGKKERNEEKKERGKKEKRRRHQHESLRTQSKLKQPRYCPGQRGASEGGVRSGFRTAQRINLKEFLHPFPVKAAAVALVKYFADHRAVGHVDCALLLENSISGK